MTLERVLWEAKMTALASGVQRCITTARAADGLDPRSCALDTLIAAVTYMRTTNGFTVLDEEQLWKEASRATPERELVSVATWRRV